MNLTATADTTRIGREINRRYREVISSIGLSTSQRAIATASTTIGNRSLTFTGTLKLLSVYDNSAQAVTLTSVGTTATGTTVAAHGFLVGSNIIITGAVQAAYNGLYTIATVPTTLTFTYTFAGAASPATGTITVGYQETQRVLSEVTFDQMRNQSLSTQPPQQYAISRMGSTTVTIYLDCIPTTVFILSADILESTTTLSGDTEPAFDQNFHDLLVHGAKVPELLKMEKPDLAQLAEAAYERRLADLRFFIAKSAYLDLVQGRQARRWWRNRV